MRQIKFRAWDTKENCYVKDIYIHTSGWHFQQHIDDHNFNIIIQLFTGLHDKNGKEIYEGDIIRALSERGFDHGFHKNEFFEVLWFLENGSWYIKRIYREDEQMGSLKEIWEMLANCDVEVVGNIYENPELLNQTPATGSGSK